MAIDNAEAKKHREFFALRDFGAALEQDWKDITSGESPDFTVLQNGMRIGIEITEAYRDPEAKASSPKEVEAAQYRFLKELRQTVKPAWPMEIYLSYVNDAKVDRSNSIETVDAVARAIEAMAVRMRTPSAALLMPPGSPYADRAKMYDTVELPAFINYVQLLRDGHKETVFCAGRAGFPPDFTDDSMRAVLRKKEVALRSYRECDQQWLVVVVNQPAHYPNKEEYGLLMSSMANCFGDIKVLEPIQTGFDRVFVFRWPLDVIEVPTV